MAHVLYGSAWRADGRRQPAVVPRQSRDRRCGRGLGDSFGDALAAGDFDGDGAADLAIGAPGENVGHVAGVVHVLYGSGAGLAAAGSQLWSQDSPGIAGVAEAGDELGVRPDRRGLQRRWPRPILPSGRRPRILAAIQSAGVVHVLYGSGAGLVAAGSQLWSQDSPGIADGAEDFDFFVDPLDNRESQHR